MTPPVDESPEFWSNAGAEPDGGNAFAYRIPQPPDGTWIPYRQSISIHGFVIANGMFYLGAELVCADGKPDPALIDPNKPVSKFGEYTAHSTNYWPSYWPSYQDMSPQDRRAYLQWLAGGRQHPDADIGYVFLYYFGLERRAILDASVASDFASDIRHIITELKRLQAVYGRRYRTFANYCSHLLGFLELPIAPVKLYYQPVPDLPPSFSLSYYLRFALGQTARDRVPVPAHLALAWAEHDPAIVHHPIARQRRGDFRRQFLESYLQQHGSGIVIDTNTTAPPLTYRPVSPYGRGTSEVLPRFGDIPDITVFRVPLMALQSTVDFCYDELTSFRSYDRVAAERTRIQDQTAPFLHLPVRDWPSQAQANLAAIRAHIDDGLIAVTLGELTSVFSVAREIDSDQMLSLARALASVQIGIEPDVLSGATQPTCDDTLILFNSKAVVSKSRNTPVYHQAQLSLGFAATIPHADGYFSPQELRFLTDHITGWTHLIPEHQRRLKAHARLLVIAPLSMSVLARQAAQFDIATRIEIANFALKMLHASPVASNEKTDRFSEIQDLLGIGRTHRISDVLLPAKLESAAQPENITSFALDASKIEEIRQDSQKLSSLLNQIFSDDLPPQALSIAVPEPTGSATMLNLDDACSMFGRMLLSRTSWSRQELIAMAHKMNIMLDGALEQLNDAALNVHDMMFAEGEDPIEINPDLIEMLTS